MRVITGICMALLLAGFFTMNLSAQTPAAATIKTLGVGNGMIALKIPGIDKPSNGLSNVGIGTKVYLYCGGKPSTGATGSPSGTHWKSATFTLLSTPSGSTASLATIDSIRVSFVADVKGQYLVGMVGTDDANATDTDSLLISAGTFVGVGGITGTPGLPNCILCHSTTVTEWNTTNHSNAFNRKIDDATGHYGPNCLGCHSTGSTDAASASGGFLDILKTSPWKFPTALKAGNYDSLKLVDPKLAAFTNIQCEMCHGPGSEHQFKKNDAGMVIRYTSDQCFQCHDAPKNHIKVAEWKNSLHYTSMNSSRMENMNQGSTTNTNSDCAKCHTSNGYIDVNVKGNQYTSAPYKDVGPVGCVTCHDPHNKTNDFQLRKDKADICIDCHKMRVSTSSMHESHQGPMLMGTGGREIPGFVYKNSAHSDIAERCVQCHMAAGPTDSTTAAIRYKVGGHSFKVVYDPGTGNPADVYLNTAGCVTCHPANMTLIEGVQDQIHALLDTLRALLPKKTNGQPLSPIGADTLKLNDAQKIASWNYYFVNNDGSFGVHNKNYAWTLLQASLGALRTTAVQKIDAPGAFNLAQNYPNPFNPSTTIEFSIPTARNVRLSVFDATGKEIFVLVNGYTEGGTYRVHWNGNTNGDQVAPSGMYFYRIAAGDFSSTRKMLLIK